MVTEGAQLAEVLALIQAQFACKGKSREWTPAVVRLYCAALTPLPYDIAVQIVVELILKLPYLPTASDIWQRAVEIASPTLPDYEAWRLVDNAMGCIRYKALPPMVAAAVRDLGGLDTLWHRKQYGGEHVGHIRSEFLGIYNQRVRAHRDAVMGELLRPVAIRDRRLFPPDSPFLDPLDRGESVLATPCPLVEQSAG